ncbi:hypothetical protein RBSH_04934 [Rhodopirellula baltica SH28]|uniref:Uncharacterized protein n=1 Tax=Rhodopirellula baltica SH28 TaxID=993517 RepID=K5D073_RHOBT|nr:hypothetical protein RBSH_04934 [Rhodopirellula baltica SH28]
MLIAATQTPANTATINRQDFINGISWWRDKEKRFEREDMEENQKANL